MIPTPPASLVKDLQNYDAALRLRWCRHRKVWAIERKLPKRHPALEQERPYEDTKAPARRDMLEGIREGYVPVLFVRPDPEVFNWMVIREALRHRDMHAWGSWEALNRRLDELALEEEREVDRMVDNFCETGAKDLHDRIQWDGGNRVSIYNPDPLAKMESHDGFKVVDRRTVALPAGQG